MGTIVIILFVVLASLYISGARYLVPAMCPLLQHSDSIAATTDPDDASGVVNEWQNRGYVGVKWWAASKLLSEKERSELCEITPHFRAWNATSTWNKVSLRWEEDFYGDPGRKGRVGPHAILPMSEARAVFRSRAFGAMKRTTLNKLRREPGFVELPPNASLGQPYGGMDAVWDIYYQPRQGEPGEVVRGHVGSVIDSGDDLSSRCISGVPSKGFRSNVLSSSTMGFTVYVVPHDMEEALVATDPALAPYLEYQQQHAKDIAQRGSAPHASFDHPEQGFMKIADGELFIFESGKWNGVARWESREFVEDKDNPYKPDDCIIQWPDGSNTAHLWYLTGRYWDCVSGIFGIARTSNNLMEVGPTLTHTDVANIRQVLHTNGRWAAQYTGVPIVGREPWPQAVYDENTVVGIAANVAQLRAYYGWDKKNP